MAILYTKNTLYICKHEESGLIEESNQTFKHTLHTSLLRGIEKIFQGPSLGSFFYAKIRLWKRKVYSPRRL